MHVTHVVLATPTALLVLALLLCTVTLTRATKRVDGAGEGGGGWGGGGGREGEGGTENKNKAGERLAAAGRLDGAEGSSELCDNARLQCTVRTGCQMALNNFFLGCSSILSGEERGCTTACQHALVSLLATEDGAGLAFINCNCSVHQQCKERKQRVQVCQRHVLHSMDLVRDHQAAVSCSFARWICEADTSCLAALHYYVQHCSKLFTGTRCTAKCRNSVHILYRQPNAHKLRSCRCEGDEDYDCPSLVTNTELLCFHRHRHQHNDSHHHHHDDHDYVSDGDGGEFRRPGRRPSPSNTQRHTSGQAAVTSLPYSGPDTAQTRPFRRRKRRNRPRRNKDKRVAWKKDRSSTATKPRRVLKRRAGPRRSKARRTRKKSCGGKGAESRNRRGLERKSKTGGRKKCHLKKSTRKRPGQPQRKTRELTPGGRRRLARRPKFVSAGLP
ncbi:uncharacterized protein [Littorina saxatilis]|uniref:GDNF/GAS1 domain-containing protein n=1 Tax=Littorina saxatilis TaxID=31220 RepID=A0AAN9C3B4_9CAEN